MNCKETQKSIRTFLDDELSLQKEQELVHHVRSCKECMEELTITYLITEGLNIFEESGDADIQKKLDEKLEAVLQKEKMLKRLKSGVVAVLAFIICVLFLT